MSTSGTSGERSAACIDRAEKLCQRLGDFENLSFILRGKWAVENQTGNIATAHIYATEMVEIASRSQDRSLTLGALASISMTKIFMGQIQEGCDDAEAGIALYNPDENLISRWSLTQPGPQCYIWAAVGHWHLGDSRNALLRSDQVLRLCVQNELPDFTRANLLMLSTWINIWCNRLQVALTQANEVEDICKDRSYDYYRLLNRVSLSLIQHKLDREGKSLDNFNKSLNLYLESGYLPASTYYLCQLARANNAMGNHELALNNLGHALSIVDQNNERWFLSDIIRTKAEILLAQKSAYSFKTLAEIKSLTNHATEIAKEFKQPMLERQSTNLLHTLHDLVESSSSIEGEE